MADKQIKKKNYRELFRKIDMMYEEVNSSGSTAENETETISPMRRVFLEQEEKGLATRKQQYAQILPSHLADNEIQPFESPRDKAAITVRSAAGCCQ